jgi:hypothetical protein
MCHGNPFGIKSKGTDRSWSGRQRGHGMAPTHVSQASTFLMHLLRSPEHDTYLHLFLVKPCSKFLTFPLHRERTPSTAVPRFTVSMLVQTKTPLTSPSAVLSRNFLLISFRGLCLLQVPIATVGHLHQTRRQGERIGQG